MINSGLLTRLILIGAGAAICAGINLSATAAERNAPVTELSATKLEERVENLERLMQKQGLLDMLTQLQELKTEIKNLRGQLEVKTNEVEQLKEQQRKLYSEIDGRLTKLESKKAPQAATPADKSPAPLPAVPPGKPVEGPAAITPPVDPAQPLPVLPPIKTEEPAGKKAESGLTLENIIQDSPAPQTEPPESADSQAPETAADPLEAQSEYQQAFKLLKDSQYDKAIAAFSAMLERYPQSQYSDSAQYWMGEAYFVTRRFNEAINEYMKLLTNYPQSNKAPNSLLKIGYSYYELKHDAEAKKVLQYLIKRYPGTSAAQDAEKRLQP